MNSTRGSGRQRTLFSRARHLGIQVMCCAFSIGLAHRVAAEPQPNHTTPPPPTESDEPPDETSSASANEGVRQGAHFSLGSGLGGFWAWAESTDTRRFRGLAPLQVSAHLGGVISHVVAGLGVHYERVTHLSADPQYDSSGVELADASELTFSLFSIGPFVRYYPVPTREWNLGLGIAISRLATSRDGDFEEPGGSMVWFDASYDLPLSQQYAYAPFVRISYHRLGVSELQTGPETNIQVVQPTVGLAIRAR